MPELPPVASVFERTTDPQQRLQPFGMPSHAGLFAAGLDQRLALSFHLAAANRKAQGLIPRVVHAILIVRQIGHQRVLLLPTVLRGTRVQGFDRLQRARHIAGAKMATDSYRPLPSGLCPFPEERLGAGDHRGSGDQRGSAVKIAISGKKGRKECRTGERRPRVRRHPTSNPTTQSTGFLLRRVKYLVLSVGFLERRVRLAALLGEKSVW